MYPSLDHIAGWYLEAMELGEITVTVAVDNAAMQAGRELGEYRHRFLSMRRQLVRRELDSQIEAIDTLLRLTSPIQDRRGHDFEDADGWAHLTSALAVIERLLGSDRPPEG